MTEQDMKELVAEALRADDEPRAYEVAEEQRKLLDAYRLAAAQMEEAKQAKNVLRDRLVDIAREHEADKLTVDEAVAATVNWTKPTTSFNTAAFKKDHPKLYDKYVRRGTCVEFRIKD